MEAFSGGELETRVMEKSGCLDYSNTPWESEKSDVYERQIHYRFDKCISRYRGEVTSTQQKFPLPDKNGWLVEEVMTLHGIPLGDNFNVWCRLLDVSFSFVLFLFFFPLSFLGRQYWPSYFFFCSFTLDTNWRNYPQNQRNVMYRCSLELNGWKAVSIRKGLQRTSKKTCKIA